MTPTSTASAKALANIDTASIIRSRMVKRTLAVLTDVAVEACCPSQPKLRPAPTTPYVKLFKSLGDETRLEIMGLLAAAGAELCACDIESHFDLSQPTISHHLEILRQDGLITGERRGTWVYYAIDRAVVARLAEFQKLVCG
ncbi:MAG: metalloregulator ArsR/SmtB family transcription factor [Byssovorax sp.]